MSDVFRKYASEERWRYFDFARTDGKDGLITGESISSAAVTCLNSTGGDCTTSMIASVSISTAVLTRVIYLLKGGTFGEIYTVKVKVLTSESQRVEGQCLIKII